MAPGDQCLLHGQSPFLRQKKSLKLTVIWCDANPLSVN